VDLVKIFHDIDCLIFDEINQLVDDGVAYEQNFLSLDPEFDLDGLRASVRELSGLESKQEEIYWVLWSIQNSEGAMMPGAEPPKLSSGTRVLQKTAITLTGVSQRFELYLS
jgi:hypothetical protein